MSPRRGARRGAAQAGQRHPGPRGDLSDEHHRRLLDSAWRDLRYGARLLRLNPAFAIVAILSLALGVGANTAIFQLLDAVRLRTLPVDECRSSSSRSASPSRPAAAPASSPGRRPSLTNPLWEQIRDRQQAFSERVRVGHADLRPDHRRRGALRRRACGSAATSSTRSACRPLIGRIAHRRRRSPRLRGAAGGASATASGSASTAAARRRSAAASCSTATPSTSSASTPAELLRRRGRPHLRRRACRCAPSRSSRGARTALDKPDVWFLGAIGRLKPGWTLEQATAQLASISAPIFQATLPHATGRRTRSTIWSSSSARIRPAPASRSCAATTSRRCGCCSRPPGWCC